MSESNIARELRELREMQSDNWYKSGGYHLADAQQKTLNKQNKISYDPDCNEDGPGWVSPEMKRWQHENTLIPHQPSKPISDTYIIMVWCSFVALISIIVVAKIFRN